MLIDSLNDQAQDKENLKESLKKCEEKLIEISAQVAKLTNEKRRLEMKQANMRKK